MNLQVSPIPTHGVGDAPTRQALEEARREATTAVLVAEYAEKEAKSARKNAAWKIKMYERLLQEYNGQLRIPDV